MRALRPVRSCTCLDIPLHPLHSLQRPPRKVRTACAAQQSDSGSSAPGGLKDLYRGLVSTPKPVKKAQSGGSKSSLSPAKAAKKQKPADSASAGGKQTTSKTQSTATTTQEQRKAHVTKKLSVTSDQQSSRSKSKKADSKAGKPTAASQPRLPEASLLPSNGKGFGSIQSSSKTIKKISNAAATAATTSSASSSDYCSDTAQDTASANGSSSRNKILKVFRFGIDAAAVQKAVDACGWRDRVLQVDVLAQADMLIAVKDTAGGKHQNLKQGERAAHNAGIPFVIVGRRMTQDSLRSALSRYLNPISPEQAAVQAAQQAKEAEAKAAADAWFSAATTARFSGSRLPTKGMQQLQQQQQKLRSGRQ